jgi:hypothetical protein
MQTSKQRRRLLKDMESEPFRSWVTLAKCGGGLAALVLIAVIGANERDGREAVSRAKDIAPHAVQPAQQHRKQVFDERRARFARGVPDHNIASETSQRANPQVFTLR